MKIPNKLYSYNESVISKLPPILRILENENMSLPELYLQVKNNFENISEYIDALVCLFILNKISLNMNTKKIEYVKDNNM